jgi:hypothetical protein
MSVTVDELSQNLSNLTMKKVGKFVLIKRKKTAEGTLAINNTSSNGSNGGLNSNANTVANIATTAEATVIKFVDLGPKIHSKQNSSPKLQQNQGPGSVSTAKPQAMKPTRNRNANLPQTNELRKRNNSNPKYSRQPANQGPNYYKQSRQSARESVRQTSNSDLMDLPPPEKILSLEGRKRIKYFYKVL